MTRKRHPDALTIHERRRLKALFGQGRMTNDQIASDLGLRVKSVARFRRSVEAENNRGSALTKTKLDYTVWLLSQREDLTEAQEKFLDIFQSETKAIWQRSWGELERQARAGSITAIEAMRSREVYPQRVAWDEIYGRNGIPS